MRSKLAFGKETGYRGKPFPRAYGMPRLQWDEELATFAQVLSNQCLLRHDLCRSTKKFANPGQTASVVRFYYPDWKPLFSDRDKSPGMFLPGLNDDKLIYAVKQSCFTWYKEKGYVTSDMILRYPDFKQHPHRRDGLLYLEMISGSSTHMGCGLSIYVDYGYFGNSGSPKRLYYAIEVICNFSARPAPNTSVYYTTIPPNANPDSKCGCLVGWVEDEDCLCVEDLNYTPPKSKMPSCVGKNCVPAVVILPIIAMEDAPLHTLKQYQNETRKNLDIINEDNSINSVANKEIYSHKDIELTHRDSRNDLERTSIITNNDLWSARHRYLPKDPEMSQNGYESLLNKGDYHGLHNSKPHPKTSLFSKSHKFELPGKGQVIKDVLPRKDFTKVQNLVDIYLNKKRNYSILKPKNNEILKGALTSSVIHDITSNVYTSDYKNVTNEDTDKKVLYLLDDLEQEVKHTDLADSEKQVLDDKLRKIYGSINNVPKNSMSSEKNNLNKVETNEFRKFENRVNKHLLEDLKRNSHRRSYIIDNDKSSEQSKNDINMLNVRKRLMEKEINGNDDLGSLKQRLEKPINENEYGFSRDIKYDAIHNTRNVNALVDFDPTSIKIRDIGNEANLEDINRRDNRKDEFKNERYPSKKYENMDLKEYTNHLDDMGELDFERRKYYQDKIDYLEERLHKSRDRQHHNKGDRQLRPLQPNRNELELRPNKEKTRKTSFYLPDRTRSVHEF